MALMKPHCLLLVDDQPKTLRLLEALLAPIGYDLLLAEGGKRAIELFDAEAPDLVLLDWVMPEVDGLAVLRYVRGHVHRSHTPVIMATAQHERNYRLSGLEAGADEFIEKPLDRAMLLARVRTLLQLKDSRDDLQASHDIRAQRNRLLERLQQEQREFAQFIVHDLKNPLSVMVGNLQWLAEKISEEGLERLADPLAEAKAAATRMRTMVEELLMRARLDEPDFPLQVEVFSVTEFLRPIVELYVRNARAKNISLVALPDGGLCVRADPRLLRRVLENILDNALRYAPQSGRIGIEVHADQMIEIRVANSGPSVPLSERRRIFEKLARGGEAPMRGHAGLGLYFCRRVLEAQGGRVDVVETPEWPTCFVIQLPLAP